MSNSDFCFDWERQTRTGIPEVVLAENKTLEQLETICRLAIEKDTELFLTRLSPDASEMLSARLSERFHQHSNSRTAFVGVQDLQSAREQQVQQHPVIGIVVAGSSDMPVATEVEQSLLYFGYSSVKYVDVGVAGLWRLTSITGELNQHPVLVAIAGMEGALFSVLSGLVQTPVVAVPASVGYGVGQGGKAALSSALSSCSPGIAVVNIDNGFGAAAFVSKLLGRQRLAYLELRGS